MAGTRPGERARVALFWRAWPYRNVEIVGGRFEGQRGQILGGASGRRLIVALDRDAECPGRTIKVEKRVVRPMPLPPSVTGKSSSGVRRAESRSA